MRYSVKKLQSKTSYLVKYHEELVMECVDLADIPLLIKDLLEHGEHEPEDLQHMKIYEQTELDFSLVPSVTYEVKLRIP